ncbi:hypothetical protein [Aureimonas altamirensis]|uniref:hypothetical protein n=1 Tax=Aureimonas altamirensis TaxID=370622 RepID=UPI002552FC00|nr:hypothetical protein [Aureimonas altamirensis]
MTKLFVENLNYVDFSILVDGKTVYSGDSLIWVDDSNGQYREYLSLEGSTVVLENFRNGSSKVEIIVDGSDGDEEHSYNGTLSRRIYSAANMLAHAELGIVAKDGEATISDKVAIPFILISTFDTISRQKAA